MTQTRIIASSGGDAINLAAAKALLTAANPISEPWVFLVNNEIIVEPATVSFESFGQTATNTITFRPQPGEGFADLHNYDTVPLEIDVSGTGGAGFHLNSGVYLYPSASASNHITFEGLQFELVNSGITLDFAGDNVKFQRNIVRGRTLVYVSATSSDALIANNLFVTEANFKLFEATASGAHVTYILHNTMVNTNSANTGADVFVDTFLGFAGGTYARAFGNVCYTPASGPKAYNAAGGAGNELNQVSHNISNTATSVWVTPNSLQSGVGVNDFESPFGADGGSRDFRPKAGGLLIEYIPSASYYDPVGTNANYASAAATDIRGRTRIGVNIEPGCFQKTSATSPGSTIGIGVLNTVPIKRTKMIGY